MRADAKDTLVALAAILPMCVAIAFISHFSIATPLTDEWLLVRNAMTLDGAPSGARGFLAAVMQMHWVCYTHPIIIPNVIYQTVAPHVNFDARLFIFLTLACNAMILLCGHVQGLRGIPLLVASVLTFSPARYMEMLWGFQFTFGLSVLLAVAGLSLLAAARDRDSKSTPVAGGLVAITLGVMCSAPAALALPAAAIAYLISHGRVLHLGGVMFLSALIVVAVLLSFLTTAQTATVLLRSGLFVLTSIGSLAFSSPVGITKFGVDARSVAGASVIALNVFMTVGTYRKGTAKHLFFGIAMIAYGLLSMIAISFFRSALGNWHLQCAVPFVVGTLWLIGMALPTPSRLRRVALTAIPLAALIGYANAFLTFGPGYRAYTERIRNYMIASVADPRLQKPYPVPKNWDTSAHLSLFLREAGNPDFLDFRPRD